MPAKAATSMIIELPDASPKVEPPREYKPLPEPAKDPVERYGVHRDYFRDNPTLLLVHLNRWTGEQLKREGGDKPHPSWYSFDYALAEMPPITVALAEALAGALKKREGRLK